MVYVQLNSYRGIIYFEISLIYQFYEDITKYE